jgi:hypothetical protein
MRSRAILLLLLTLFMPATNACAQVLDKVTDLKLEYWRAFDGLIAIRVIRTIDNELALSYTITAANDPDGKSAQHGVKKIKEADLTPVLTFFNFGDVREYFATNAPVRQGDGANLSVTVTQNSFSLSFASQNAFSSKESRFPNALGKVALHLFKLANISITKDKLY